MLPNRRPVHCLKLQTLWFGATSISAAFGFAGKQQKLTRFSKRGHSLFSPDDSVPLLLPQLFWNSLSASYLVASLRDTLLHLICNGPPMSSILYSNLMGISDDQWRSILGADCRSFTEVIVLRHLRLLGHMPIYRLLIRVLARFGRDRKKRCGDQSVTWREVMTIASVSRWFDFCALLCYGPRDEDCHRSETLRDVAYN